jgi:hypothetical protein
MPEVIDGERAGWYAYQGHWPQIRDQRERRTWLKLVTLDMEDRRRAWLTVAQQLESEGFLIGKRNQDRDPARWSARMRSFVLAAHLGQPF